MLLKGGCSCRWFSKPQRPKTEWNSPNMPELALVVFSRTLYVCEGHESEWIRRMSTVTKAKDTTDVHVKLKSTCRALEPIAIETRVTSTGERSRCVEADGIVMTLIHLTLVYVWKRETNKLNVPIQFKIMTNVLKKKK